MSTLNPASCKFLTNSSMNVGFGWVGYKGSINAVLSSDMPLMGIVFVDG